MAASPQCSFWIANYHGPWLVDVAGGLISLVCLALFLRMWQPKTSWHFADEGADVPVVQAKMALYSGRQIASAWVPWALLTIFVFAWGIPDVKIIGQRTHQGRCGRPFT